MLAFAKAMDPTYTINWHHRVIANHLDRFLIGDITRLMIFEPPQTGKSELVSRKFPAYAFGKFPDEKIMLGTYGDEFASQFNLDVQKNIDSDKYRSIFPNTRLRGSGDDSGWLRNSSVFDIVGRRGRYNSVGVGGPLTGKTGNILIIDDPIKNIEEALSETYRNKMFRWYSSVARTRLKRNVQGIPPRILVTLTRWHEDDLAARLLKIAKDNPGLPQWTVLNFPALRENLDDPLDPRKLDEPLWPWWMTRQELEEIRLSDPRTWSSLYQQRPSPEAGNIVERGWWKYYTVLPADMEIQIQSWDLTYKKGKSTDYTVGCVWGKSGANKYLLDMVRARMGFNDQLASMISLSAKWPNAVGKYVEQAANAEALLDTLKSKISGINLVPAKSSKTIRAQAVAPEIKSGNVWLPDPSIAPWVHDFIEEWAAFPNGTNDDQVDASSLGLKKLDDGMFSDWSPASIKKKSIWNK